MKQEEPPAQPPATHKKNEWEIEIEGEMAIAPGVSSRDMLPIILSRSEVDAMICAPSLAPAERLVVRTLYASGLRALELLAFEWDHLVEHRIHVAGDYPRTALIDRVTRADLEAAAALPSPKLFSGSLDDLTALVQRSAPPDTLARYRATQRVLLPRALRHAYATHCLEAGMDLFVLRDLLGHRYMDTTQMYLGAAVGRWRPAYSQHHPFAARPF